MSFHWPYLLFAPFLALGVLLVLFRTSQRARHTLLGQFAAARLLPMLLASHSPTLRRTKEILLAVGVVLVALSFARPQWGYEWEEQHAQGVDVIFVVDTSKSMLSQDVQPSRLERAKLAILDCVEKMAGNRVGLVAFAGDAFLQCPLTLDYDAFRQTLESVDTNTIAYGGTDIAAGLDEAATALENSGNHKIIVLLTDGEDLAAQGVTEAHELADRGVTIYAVGVGTPGGEIIPYINAQGQSDFVRDQRGQIVTSHLDAGTLTGIAEATHGFYQPLGATGEGLAKVYSEGIAKIPEQNLKSQMHRNLLERFQWPLGLGILLLAIEMLVGTRRPVWSRRPMTTINLADPLPASPTKSSTPRPPPVVVALLFLLLGFLAVRHVSAADQLTPSANPASANPPSSAPAVSGKNYTAKDAQSFFQNGDYKSAAEAYRQAAEAAPQDSRFTYDEGASLYRSGNFDAAADAFTKTLSSNDLGLQQQAYYNLGNTHYRLGQADAKQDPKKTTESWEQAVKDYQNALELNSSDADAKYNLGLVKKQLEELKKQQQQQQSSQDQKDQKDSPQNQQQNQSQQNQNNSQQNQQQQNQSSSNQNQQNSSGSQNQSGQKNGAQPQPKPSNGSNGKNQTAQNQNGAQNSANQQAGDQGQKPQDASGKNGEPKQPGDTSGDKNGTEPNSDKNGQSPHGGAMAGWQDANGPADQNANGTIAIGAMTREEARQLLDSLKPVERKLPASNLQNPNSHPNNDQYQKDW